jgi:hypothetical protein
MTTLSSLSNVFYRPEKHRRKISSEIELQKIKLINRNSNEDCPRWRKFNPSRCRLDQFSRMDSVISSTCEDNECVFPFESETRNSANVGIPSLLTDKNVNLKTKHKGVHQDKNILFCSHSILDHKVHNHKHVHRRNDTREPPISVLESKISKIKSQEKEYFSSKLKNEDTSVVFAQLQVKDGEANVIYLRTHFKKHDITKTQSGITPMHKFNHLTEAKGKQARLSAHPSPWKSLASQAA